jgi:hypothetical protein
MSRKKSSRVRVGSPGKTPAPAHAITSAPASPIGPAALEPQAASTAVADSQTLKKVPITAIVLPRSQQRFWLEVAAVKVASTLGSLKIAIFSLAFFALVLAVGTKVESDYSGKVAQELVYRTWWFTLLLCLLATNILFAALKKMDRARLARFAWPWKKHQTGFLITHAGLLTLVAGGLVNALGGTDSLLVLVDASDVETQNREGVPQQSNMMMDRDAGLIRVRAPGQQKVVEYDFNPGSLPWRTDEYVKGPRDWLLNVLDIAAHPLPRSWGVDLGHNARLDVLSFYPHVRTEEYSEAGQDIPKTHLFPAVKVELTSPRFGRLKGQWLAVETRKGESTQVSEVGPSMVELLGRCPPELLSDFLHPPDPGKLGPKGLLVVHWQGKTYPAIRVDDRLGKGPVALGNLRISLTQYIRALRYDEREREGAPDDPAVKFEVSLGDKQRAAPFMVLARLTGEVVPLNEEAVKRVPDLNDLKVWYHPPDYRYNSLQQPRETRGLLQFVQRQDNGKLYFRSFNSHKGDFVFEDSGPLKNDRESRPVWSGMAWHFRVLDHIEHAVRKRRFVPVDLKPGSEVAGYQPAIRAKLTVKDESKVVWVQQSGDLLRSPDNYLVPVEAAGETYEIGYSVQFREMPFDLKLLRAEQEVDPGTHSPASYASYVQLTDPGQKIDGEDRVIYMNHPLDHRGYKFYQSGYESLGFNPQTLRPVNRSTFTVGHDPGMFLKYLGTFMLAGGISCMFYMRAYFFKPRGRARTTPAATLPVSSGA